MTKMNPTDPKPRSNHRLYIETLRKMTPSEHLHKAFELSEFTRLLFKEGLRQRFSDKSEEEIHVLFLKRIQKCYNRNY